MQEISTSISMNILLCTVKKIWGVSESFILWFSHDTGHFLNISDFEHVHKCRTSFLRMLQSDWLQEWASSWRDEMRVTNDACCFTVLFPCSLNCLGHWLVWVCFLEWRVSFFNPWWTCNGNFRLRLWGEMDGSCWFVRCTESIDFVLSKHTKQHLVLGEK